MCDKALELTKAVYLDESDINCLDVLIDKFHGDITWRATNCRSMLSGISTIKQYLIEEFKNRSDLYRLKDAAFAVYPLSDKFCYVCSDVTMLPKVESANDIPNIMQHTTYIWGYVDGDLFLHHVHISVDDDTITSDSAIKTALVERNNALLEQRLRERTHMLNEKTDELERLANNVFGGVIICNFDDKFTIKYASDGFFPLIGYSRTEFEGTLSSSLGSLLTDNDAKRICMDIHEQLNSKNSFSIEYRINKKDGSVITVLDNGVLLPKKDNDDTTYLQSILTDITAQKEVETNLRISEKRYEVALQASEISIFEYNLLTKDLTLFGGISDMYGITSVIPNGPETFVRTGIIDAEYGDDYLEMYRQIHSGVLNANCFVTTKDKDGQAHDYMLSLTNVFDENGKPIRAIGVRKNITDLRQLRKEQDFAKTMSAESHLIYEANITRDVVISYDIEWAKSVGISEAKCFSQVIGISLKKAVPIEFHDMINQRLSAEFIIEAFERGQKVINFEYKRKFNINQYQWHKQTVNIIKDTITGDIFVRGYISNINNKKIREQRQIDDRKLYEAMLSKASTLYEINVTQDLFIAGHEDWAELFGIEPTNSYDVMMTALMKKAIHPDDVDKFAQIYTRDNILKAHSEGQYQLIMEYRRPSKSGDFIWVKCTLHLYDDPHSGDIKGHSYIEDIDDEKRKEIQLIYNAEHDFLTTLLNKAATEKYINNFLESSEGKSGKHAFFIIDLDNFKAINDNFGHAFGDAVLSRSATNLKELFRDIDILGRIGGDEFVVLIKNIGSAKVAINKAREICQKLFDSYSKEEKVHTISTSIGVALYPTHGKDYTSLYKNSDTALYISKEMGRNRYTTYNSSMEPMVSTTNEIDVRGNIEPKVFENNIVEYAFKVIYETNNKAVAISSVLELIGKHYNVSRAYIFEYTKDGDYLNNTFEWCNVGISPQKENLQNIPNSSIVGYDTLFEPDGIMLLPNIENASDDVKRLIEPQDIISMVQFGIYKKDKFVGFIGFDECEYSWEPTKREISDLQNISNILSVFLQEMRSVEKINEMRNISMSIIHALDSYAYVCDPENFEILFVNNKTLELIEDIATGCTCYKVIRGLDKPCGNCPMIEMIRHDVDRYSMEVFNQHLNITVNATSSWIDWIDGKHACLINSIDITQYKQ